MPPRYISSSVLAVSSAATVASGIFLKKSPAAKPSPLASPLWDVTRVGVDLPKVIEEYKTTLSSGELKADGYSPAGCFPDNNLKARDLHGKSTAYEGPISVIRYEDVVAKTEQKAMTPNVCYEFCRRFDGVKFFGITNGSKCYCEPMFVVGTAGNTGGCKVACAGNPGQMCGGPDASSIFEMHDCPPKELFGPKAVVAFNELKNGVSKMTEDVSSCAKALVSAGSKLVTTQKQKGNTISMKHQAAMTQSYQALIADVNALPFDGKKVAAALEKSLGTYAGVSSGTGKASDTEAAMNAVEAASDAASAALPALVKVYETCAPDVEATDADLSTYKTIEGSQTCDGKIITPVHEVADVNACAKLCTETLAPTQCVGFQHYFGLAQGGTCLMFSEITGIAVYTKEGCGNGMGATCYVPKVDFAAHELAVKSDTLILDYCFDSK